MPADVARPEVFVQLAAVAMVRGQRAWPWADRAPRERARRALQQALADVLVRSNGDGGDAAGVPYADALASALVGAIPSARWTLKPAGQGGTIVGKI